MAKEIDNYFHNIWSDNQHETIFIGWRRPREGWVKLNCDGSQNDRLGLASCGGLLRNSDGTWLKGYSRKLGICDVLHAEMWGMYLGLDLARREGIMQLYVESDSKILIDMVTDKIKFKGNIPL
ncbi:SKP1 protein [Trifolium repens]|jgi:ribonuclease HI|nr:SKP1 protein [Trifolium repens]